MIWKIYLAGSIEFSEDGGRQWRNEMKEDLTSLGFDVVNPHDLQDKVIDQEIMKKLKTKNIDQYVTHMRQIINVDLNNLNKCNILVCKWNGEMSAGTIHEAGHAYEKGISTYLLTDKNKEDIPGWFLACFNKVFHSQKDLYNHLKAYKIMR